MKNRKIAALMLTVVLCVSIVAGNTGVIYAEEKKKEETVYVS